MNWDIQREQEKLILLSQTTTINGTIILNKKKMSAWYSKSSTKRKTDQDLSSIQPLKIQAHQLMLPQGNQSKQEPLSVMMTKHLKKPFSSIWSIRTTQQELDFGWDWKGLKIWLTAEWSLIQIFNLKNLKELTHLKRFQPLSTIKASVFLNRL